MGAPVDQSQPLEEVIERGRRATQLMEDPLMREAFIATEESFIQTWRNAKTVADRESAHAHVIALGRVAKYLRIIMEDGVRATDQLKRQERREHLKRQQPKEG
jgi:hypothetical protein